ncbi:putative inactive metalloprotease YmfF [Paenibacillus baekrokdamisoli]|uniref:Putative inactive metalloprotease YmfF n=1 Tax=Paenibacillus baekrokdamisoli TaxID=1712516 RepID=A0A3G9JA80_9BACL|nr:pitrilysin family protein [Paenibacillus baekrokdamisoli]MBB3069838.1 putative Zn-dependent peptidase [Paenibacillus baekrokdamisoli]BBH20808.1 putative inactive metalloprotease YmfF [Paenibacillus baekrokdamisoli]
MTKSRFERGLIDRIRLHVMPTQRFKTFSISLYAGLPLAEDTVTSVALIPFVLRRGTASTPETIAFRERLDDLYGAGFGFDVYKRGDAQIVQFRMDVINDRFVSSEQPLLSSSLKLLGEVLTEPAMEAGLLRSKYVDAEKDTLRKRLEAIINDKIRYAAERCLEEMCQDEPYRLHPLGKLDAIDAITPQSLTDSYQQWLSQASFDLYVVGDTTLEEVKNLVSQAFQMKGGKPSSYTLPAVQKPDREVRTIIEKMDVSQGKLNMGLRINTSYGDDDYPAALMYNGILGGYPHSKLFLNVREKASLAYYAASRLDGHKGICTIQSGIEIENFDRATEIIQQQLESMRSGSYSDLEMNQTKAMIANHLREIQDSANEMIGFDFNAILSGRERTAEQLMEQVQSVTAEQIAAVARKTELDTIYFLRDEKEG